MGGYGSGRRSGKQKQDLLPRISLSLLHRNGYLIEGCVSIIQWYRQKRCLGLVKVTAANNGLLFECHLHQLDANLITECIQLIYTPCNYGGSRPWVLCPGCGRKVMFLYARTTCFRCRHCCRLTYASRNEGYIDTLLRRVHRSRRKVGAGDDLTQPIPPKPKWKHHLKHRQRTYRAMLQQMDLCQFMKQEIYKSGARDEKGNFKKDG